MLLHVPAVLNLIHNADDGVDDFNPFVASLEIPDSSHPGRFGSGLQQAGFFLILKHSLDGLLIS